MVSFVLVARALGDLDDDLDFHYHTLDARPLPGRVIEIDKTRQLLYAVLDGQLQWVFHTSTGTEEPYQHPAGYTATADTPPGRHTVDWRVDGWRDRRLGRMYRPKYFHGDGIALHGYHAIAPHPASHGCARSPSRPWILSGRTI
ncbi:MAG: L,D-transpeptidase [Actinobacteria bacterium]|nr:L,D-transpeptidase [Actinomycetota bacterium]